MKKSKVAANPLERRKQKRLDQLGTQTPSCVNCHMDRWECLELHHLGGKTHGEEMVIVCRNCHAELSDSQKDHPVTKHSPTSAQSTGYQLLGEADLFAMLADSRRIRGTQLIETEKEKSK